MTADSALRVRFAPSPTGFLHVGGARAALYNWLFARRRGGKFVLRIEDSDLKRNQPEMVEAILRDLRWIGMDWDEGPHFQSRRIDLYREHAHRLREGKKAFASASPEGEAIVFKIGEETVAFPDLIRGEISISSREFKDIVLIKSDGTPTYNFACVVDDHEMGITHVIRGEDHITNTPKQIILYRALGWTPPAFAHLPLILGPDKAPLSKRHGATSLEAFRRQGYLPQAMMNYLALLGWSPGNDREILSPAELVREFSLERVNKSAAVFDYQKLAWLNGQYLAKLPPREVAALAIPILKDAGWGEAPREKVERVVQLLGQRLKVISDILKQGDYLFQEEVAYRPEAVEKFWRREGVAGLLAREREVLAKVEPFTAPETEKAVRQLMTELGMKGGEVLHPLRLAITGRDESPGIFEIMEILGKARVRSRLDQALERLAGGA